MIRLYCGGPKDSSFDYYYSPVPPQEIKIFADTPDGLVCADEQVIELLGKYVRSEKIDGGWRYEWIELLFEPSQERG